MFSTLGKQANYSVEAERGGVGTAQAYLDRV